MRLSVCALVLMLRQDYLGQEAPDCSVSVCVGAHVKTRLFGSGGALLLLSVCALVPMLRLDYLWQEAPYCSVSVCVGAHVKTGLFKRSHVCALPYTDRRSPLNPNVDNPKCR